MDGGSAISLGGPATSRGEVVTIGRADRAAGFDAFFTAEHPRLVATVLAITGDRALAEDVAQEALTRAYHRWEEVGAYDRPGAWTRRVALNLATSAGRRRRSERRALGRLAGRRQEVRGDATDPAARHGDDDLWVHVRALPPRQATALVLFYVADEGVAGVAEAMGCAEGTAKAHLHQGRAALARRLGDAATRAPAPVAGTGPTTTPTDDAEAP